MKIKNSKIQKNFKNFFLYYETVVIKCIIWYLYAQMDQKYLTAKIKLVAVSYDTYMHEEVKYVYNIYLQTNFI